MDSDPFSTVSRKMPNHARSWYRRTHSMSNTPDPEISPYITT